MAQKEIKTGRSIAGLVCGIIGVVLAFIPGINVAAIILGILAIIFGGIAIAKKQPRGKSIAALVLGIIAVGAAFAINATTVKVIDEAVNEASSELNKMTGDSTAEILGKDVEVTIGEFSAVTSAYGLTDTKLPVTVKNLTSGSKSFNIQIEAVNANGDRIDDSYVYASNLSAGQSQSFEAFTIVTSDKVEALKTAKFSIIQIQEF